MTHLRANMLVSCTGRPACMRRSIRLASFCTLVTTPPQPSSKSPAMRPRNPPKRAIASKIGMAVGKCNDTNINQDHVVIRFGTQEVYPHPVSESGLAQLSEYMKGSDVLIHVSLNNGSSTATVWGCDLTDGYVRINADYTT